MFDHSISQMAADSSMGFQQGITPSFYNHHMLSFQSADVNTSGSTFMFSRGMHNSMESSSSSSSAGLFLSPNRSMVGNTMAGSSAGKMSSGFHRSAQKLTYLSGSPVDWTLNELAILKDGLIRYAHEPNIMKYIKIAAMLPSRTIRDVALRCWWMTNKESSKRRKPEDFYTGKKLRDLKDKMFASSLASVHMASSSNVTPFSVSMYQPNLQSRVSSEGPAVDNATRQLLQENNQLLNQIAANIQTFKMQDNMDMFLLADNNFKAIMSRMSETPGIMCQMPPLPVSINADQLHSVIRSDRMVGTYGMPSGSPFRSGSLLKQEP